MNLYSDRLGKLNFDGTDGSLNYINLSSLKLSFKLNVLLKTFQ